MNKMTKSFLTKDWDVFAGELSNRIAQGNNMLQQQVSTDDAFKIFKNEISEWSDYNRELLKQSFDNPDNEYLNEYSKSHLPLGSLGSSRTLAEKANNRKKEIFHYIAYLKKTS